MSIILIRYFHSTELVLVATVIVKSNRRNLLSKLILFTLEYNAYTIYSLVYDIQWRVCVSIILFHKNIDKSSIHCWKCERERDSLRVETSKWFSKKTQTHVVECIRIPTYLNTHTQSLNVIPLSGAIFELLHFWDNNNTPPNLWLFLFIHRSK